MGAGATHVPCSQCVFSAEMVSGLVSGQEMREPGEVPRLWGEHKMEKG